MAYDPDQSTNDRIRAAGWFKGTSRDWDKLPIVDRETLAFTAVGCAVAYPTWTGPVDCVHTGCQVLRGEVQPIVQTNRILRSEMESGWLRFDKDSSDGRKRLATLCKAIRRAALASGVFDPWKIPGGWQSIVGNACSPD